MNRADNPADVAADVRNRVRKKIAAMLRKAKIANCHPWINGLVLDEFVSKMDDREAATPGGRSSARGSKAKK